MPMQSDDDTRMDGLQHQDALGAKKLAEGTPPPNRENFQKYLTVASQNKVGHAIVVFAGRWRWCVGAVHSDRLFLPSTHPDRRAQYIKISKVTCDSLNSAKYGACGVLRSCAPAASRPKVCRCFGICGAPVGIKAGNLP